MATGQHVVPLLVWQDHPLTAEDVERIKDAKRSLELPYLMQLARATPESDGRVLAIGSRPDFPCDFVLVKSTKDAALSEAVAWCLGEREDDEHAVDIIEMLESALGGPVREVEDANESTMDRPGDGGELVLPEHEPGCESFGTTGDCGLRGCTDPNALVREQERAIREADKTQP